ncbi:spike base protein, RCAP_Rcc01079 family [Nevskia ramosa]|uniref:spike base protein, RCAP_Rcc01079 family n=1 Tax=Nevskia ramosa TaxID=64002 RepID=UPI003D0F988C
MASRIDSAEIQGMVGHWLGTPEFGYLGSAYGSNLPIALFAPLAAGRADAILSKLRGDVPVLSLLPPGSVNLFSEQVLPDRQRIFVTVGGELVVADAATPGAGGIPATVVDSDVQFSLPQYESLSTDTAVTVTVVRSVGRGGAISVAYSTANSSALAGTDYVATSGVLTWGASDFSDRTIDVPTINSGDARQGLIASIALSPLGDARLGGQAIAALVLRKAIEFVDFTQSAVVPSDAVFAPVPYGGLTFPEEMRIVLEGVNGIAVPMTMRAGTVFTGMTPKKIRPIGTDVGKTAFALTSPSVTSMRAISGNAAILAVPSDSTPLPYPAIGGLYSPEGGQITFIDDGGTTRSVVLPPEVWYAEYVITQVKATGTDAEHIHAFVRLPTTSADADYA